ncbi:hypothetical protein HZB02_01200 [Candidatus Woesearchaeota archaeon]|nr:hypothetical protein [Candidatus Woesearchaeota archaeon]
MDLIQPSGNAEAFLDRARLLGHQALFIIGKQNPLPTSGIELTWCSLHPQRGGVVIAQSSVKDRQLMEQGKIQWMFGFEDLAWKDSMHQRRSGLDHVLCKIMQEKQIGYIITLAHLRDEKRLGRILQNIKLCRKHKVAMMLATFAQSPDQLRGAEDMKALERVLKIR